MSTDADNAPRGSRASRYARCRSAARSVEWDLDRDVLRGRTLDFSRRFLPDGLSLLDRLDFLPHEDALLLSQLQGRTYAGTLDLVARFIGAALLQTHDHIRGDREALQPLVRFASEELKHQELFRRLDHLMSAGMPPGYDLIADPNEVAGTVLGRSAWSLLALTCQMQLLAQAHYEQAFESREELCPLYKDVFGFHARDERQHASPGELEWTAVHAQLSEDERDQAVVDFIALLHTVGGILQGQAHADARYFLRVARHRFTPVESQHVESTILAACRWQFIVSGMQHVHFRRLLSSMTTTAQCARIMAALQPLMQA